MKRLVFFAYSLIAYALFLGVFLYTVGFVGNFRFELLPGWVFVPRSLDLGGERGSTGQALLVDALLLGAFAVQHSGMARRGFKQRWTRLVPPTIERATYVLFSSVALAAVLGFWRPLGFAVWTAGDPAVRTALVLVSLIGWLTALAATFHIHHFELFGLRQTWSALLGRELPPPRFVTPGLYRHVRHPLYLGFLVAFWATPVMTVGHLVFALGFTGYILVAIQFEERDLVREYGPAYLKYREQVPMLAPLPGRPEATRQAKVEP